MAEEPAGAERISDGRSAYEVWMEREGLPIVGGYYIPDLREVEVARWEREGAYGAFVNLIGAEETNGAHVVEIPPKSDTRPHRHLFEEVIYVLEGRGSTSVWQEPERRQTFEWQEGSLFAIPVNAWHRHFNLHGSQAARLFVVTSAPLVMNLFHNEAFVFDCPFAFEDRFSPPGGDAYFSAEGRAFAERIWESNFVPDVRTLPLLGWRERGGGTSQRRLELADGSMCAHISEFATGTYKKAHRHGPGAHVVIIAGTGYSLMWPEGSPMQRFDWGPGSVVVPPDRWFHQHFNLGSTNARYLAMRWGSRKHKVFRRYKTDADVKSGGAQIEYEDEDPRVRAMYVEECARRGVRIAMEEIRSDAG